MSTPRVAIVMGSESDWPTMKGAAEVLKQYDVPFESRVVSAHRTPERMAEFGRTAHERGFRVLIAGAGGAAHLPGMLASYTPLPVIGVPVAVGELRGMDALLSIVQMPRGVPVATVAIGNSTNAGILAVQILATHDHTLLLKLQAARSARAAAVEASDDRLQAEAAAIEERG